MAESLKDISVTPKLFGAEYKQKLHFVPCADNEPKVGHEISEAALFRFLLNEETLREYKETEVELPEMLRILKDIDKESKITEFETHQSSMNKVADWNGAFHVFIVFKTCATDGVYWWSLEKNLKYIVLQRSRNKNNVKDKLYGDSRTRGKSIKEDLKGKGTIKDLFGILWAQQLIPENYNIFYSNCQSLVSFVGQQITELGYNYEGYFPYSPPPEKGRDKKMLELINVVRGYSDWPPLFYLIKMGNTDLVDKTVASGKYDINALYNGLTPLHLAIRLEKTKMVQHLLQHPMNADPTKRDESGKSALLLAVSMFVIKEEIIDLLLAHDKVNVDDVDGDGRTALHLAAAAFLSNVIAFKKLLENGANPKILDKKGQSPLHLAARSKFGNPIIDLLLAHDKVKVDDVNKDGKTALHIAAYNYNVVVVEKLIEKGANPNVFDNWAASPIHLAAGKRHGNKIMDLLLAHDKVKVDDVDGNGQTALHIAAYNSNVHAVQKLLEKGANPNIYDKKGRSPLHVAVRKRDDNEIMDLLLAHSKVNVDDVNGKGQTALHIAAYKSNVEVAKSLINKGANPNAVDKSGDSPLHVAAMRENVNPIIDVLLEAKKVKDMGDVNDRNKQGRTALHYAAAYSHEITAEHLIKKGANVNCRTNVDDTPLHYAVLGAKDMKIIDLLLRNINEGDIQQYRNDERLFFFARHNLHGLGDTILDRLVEKGIQPPCTETDDCTGESDEAITGVNTRRFVLDKVVDPSIDLTGFDGLDFLIARVKISLGIYDDINGHDQIGQTLLLVAIRANNVNWVRNLLERGADPTIRDKYGDTPFHVAVENCGEFNILNLLLESGKVDINETSEYGETALHMAVLNSNTATAEFLLSKGANPNVTTKYGRTPLHLAAWYAKDMDIVELLLNHKDVDVNYLNNRSGSSALGYAKYNENGLGERIANLLKEKGAVESEDKLPKVNKESLETLLKYTSRNAKDEIESILSDATVPNEDQIARINEEHFLSAIEDSDVERVCRLLKNGADISSARGKYGMNALHVASEYAKTTDLIDVILQTGKFDINGLDNNGNTPLHWAISGTYLETNARHLIQLGADPTIANKEGDTPLHLAASCDDGEIETISLILENEQVDINRRGNNGRTALHRAIEASSEITARYLLKKGADPNVADENGVTPLHLEAKEDNWETTELIDIILKTGKCNINGVDDNGWTPLHYALMESNFVRNAASHLIRKGADPTIANKIGDTPLHLAASCDDGEIETISLILENEQVDINSRGSNGRTALHRAIEASSEITVRYLLKKGADPNAADENGATPLHLAAETEYYWETKRSTPTELIDIILETGKCNINGVDNYGRTPLHYAIGNYFPVTINARRLIEMGADPCIADKSGVTPLHLAAENAKSMDLIDELLLKVKTGSVDVNCVDIKGRTPLACAQDNKRGLVQRIIDRLKEYGAKE